MDRSYLSEIENGKTTQPDHAEDDRPRLGHQHFEIDECIKPCSEMCFFSFHVHHSSACSVDQDLTQIAVAGFLIPQSLASPSVDCCLDTSPSRDYNSRPL